MAAFESNARRLNFNLSTELLVHRTSHLAARMSVERIGQRHSRPGFKRRERRDLDRQLGMIAYTGERLGEFEHVVLSEILRFNRSGHEHRITVK
jgi:hypothetical protein